VRAIHVADTGIVDYRQVSERLAERVREREGQVLTNARVTGLKQQPNGIVMHSTAGDVRAKCVVTCAGLHCDGSPP
jgi:L-2-hydroxyglutarate oxidase